MSPCPFCDPSRLVLRNALAGFLWDGYPVTPGHGLVVPLRHAPTLFDLTPEEVAAVWEILQQARDLPREGPAIDGWNVGVNVGAAGGQSVFHCHVHLIPRRRGDDPSPRGGVRKVLRSLSPY
ncbi:MAG: HIT family protein [Deltaproteobacteria bacterium]|nr:HIT family protein [Deltaproteobacteria bacterium]